MLSPSESISVSQLEKKFGRFVAVNKITFSVKKGEIFGFLGSNGSGKSTTIRMLCGIITPTSGNGMVAGYDMIRQPEEIKQAIGYMSQKFSLYEDLTPSENVRFYLGIYSVPQSQWPQRIDWILNMTRLQDVRNRLRGNCRRAGVRRLVKEGEASLQILFLDEPTSGVDPITTALEFLSGDSRQTALRSLSPRTYDEALCERIA